MISRLFVSVVCCCSLGLAAGERHSSNAKHSSANLQGTPSYRQVEANRESTMKVAAIYLVALQMYFSKAGGCCMNLEIEGTTIIVVLVGYMGHQNVQG